MGINVPLIIYTHSDYKDVWKLLFGQIQKYLPNQKVYVLSDTNADEIPSEFTTLIYDDSKIYTERLKQCLSQIEEEVVLFQHEDMILFNQPQIQLFDKYIDYVKNEQVDSVKLIYVAENDNVSEVDSTLISNQYSKFSIQPTLIKLKKFVSLLESTQPLNIWDFELAVPADGNHYMVKLGEERKRGIYHYDSIIYPYIATAIVKGKWNYGEYMKELDELFNEYGIIPFERGIA
jgi:hypothetical protein